MNLGVKWSNFALSLIILFNVLVNYLASLSPLVILGNSVPRQILLSPSLFFFLHQLI